MDLPSPIRFVCLFFLAILVVNTATLPVPDCSPLIDGLQAHWSFNHLQYQTADYGIYWEPNIVSNNPADNLAVPVLVSQHNGSVALNNTQSLVSTAKLATHAKFAPTCVNFVSKREAGPGWQIAASNISIEGASASEIREFLLFPGQDFAVDWHTYIYVVSQVLDADGLPATRATLYVDGVATPDRIVEAPRISGFENDVPLVIGKPPKELGIDTPGFSGAVDDVLYFNRALEAQHEIRYLHDLLIEGNQVCEPCASAHCHEETTYCAPVPPYSFIGASFVCECKLGMKRFNDTHCIQSDPIPVIPIGFTPGVGYMDTVGGRTEGSYPQFMVQHKQQLEFGKQTFVFHSRADNHFYWAKFGQAGSFSTVKIETSLPCESPQLDVTTWSFEGDGGYIYLICGSTAGSSRYLIRAHPDESLVEYPHEDTLGYPMRVYAWGTTILLNTDLNGVRSTFSRTKDVDTWFEIVNLTKIPGLDLVMPCGEALVIQANNVTYYLDANSNSETFAPAPGVVFTTPIYQVKQQIGCIAMGSSTQYYNTMRLIDVNIESKQMILNSTSVNVPLSWEPLYDGVTGLKFRNLIGLNPNSEADYVVIPDLVGFSLLKISAPGTYQMIGDPFPFNISGCRGLVALQTDVFIVIVDRRIHLWRSSSNSYLNTFTNEAGVEIDLLPHTATSTGVLIVVSRPNQPRELFYVRAATGSPNALLVQPVLFADNARPLRLFPSETLDGGSPTTQLGVLALRSPHSQAAVRFVVSALHDSCGVELFTFTPDNLRAKLLVDLNPTPLAFAYEVTPLYSTPVPQISHNLITQEPSAFRALFRQPLQTSVIHRYYYLDTEQQTFRDTLPVYLNLLNNSLAFGNTEQRALFFPPFWVIPFDNGIHLALYEPTFEPMEQANQTMATCGGVFYSFTANYVTASNGSTSLQYASPIPGVISGISTLCVGQQLLFTTGTSTIYRVPPTEGGSITFSDNSLSLTLVDYYPGRGNMTIKDGMADRIFMIPAPVLNTPWPIPSLTGAVYGVEMVTVTPNSAYLRTTKALIRYQLPSTNPPLSLPPVGVAATNAVASPVFSTGVRGGIVFGAAENDTNSYYYWGDDSAPARPPARLIFNETTGPFSMAGLDHLILFYNDAQTFAVHKFNASRIDLSSTVLLDRTQPAKVFGKSLMVVCTPLRAKPIPPLPPQLCLFSPSKIFPYTASCPGNGFLVNGVCVLEGDLNIDNETSVIIGDVYVPGNLNQANGTLQVTYPASITVEGCATLDGTLVYDISNTANVSSESIISLINAGCISGGFASISVVGGDQCKKYTATTQSTNATTSGISLSLLFDVTPDDSCNPINPDAALGPDFPVVGVAVGTVAGAVVLVAVLLGLFLGVPKLRATAMPFARRAGEAPVEAPTAAPKAELLAEL